MGMKTPMKRNMVGIIDLLSKPPDTLKRPLLSVCGKIHKVDM
jgi:hypothetical protein